MLHVAIDEDGTGYYLALPASQAAPATWQVIAANNSFAMAANAITSVRVTGLSAATAYKIYFVAKDQAGNAQTNVSTANVTTFALPTTAGPTISAVGSSAFSFTVTLDNAGTGYYLVKRANEVAPTISEVIAARQSFAMTANNPVSRDVYGLQSLTPYTLYFVAQNKWGEAQTSLQHVTATTASASGTNTHGYVLQGNLTWMPISSTASPTSASSYCASFAGLGYHDWRQPSTDELVSLSHSGAWRNQGWIYFYVWAGGSPFWGGDAYYYPAVFLEDGQVISSSATSRTAPIYVSCVRQGVSF